MGDNNKSNNSEAPDCYAFLATPEIREKSSSGGAFPVLAAHILNDGGAVAGVAWADDFSVQHMIIENISDLHKLQRSKYVQSFPGNIYNEVKTMLSSGRKVLFSGCPCQVAALYKCLDGVHSNLFTIDIICNHAPSTSHFQKYLDDEFGIQNLSSCDFRIKHKGWNATSHQINMKDGKEIIRNDDDPFQQGFHSRLFISHTCEKCPFREFPRWGDVTLGDFWGIAEHIAQLDDGKGTSAILVNNQRGMELLSILEQNAIVCEKVILEWVTSNNLHNKFITHPARNRYFELIKYMSFEKAVKYCLENKWDVGIVGPWSVENYGSNMAYYALYWAVRDLGLEPLMIERPLSAHWQPNLKPHAFKSDPYRAFDISPMFNTKKEMELLNKYTNVFLVGSDQLFYDGLYHAFGKYIALDWVHDDKNKSSYAASFGFDKFTGSREIKTEMSYYMRKFDHFSVREDSGVKIARDDFGVVAQHVLDPVFLCNKKHFDRLAESGKKPYEESYCAVYLMDSSDEKLEVIRQVSERLILKTNFFYAKEKIFYTKEIVQYNEYISNEDWLCNIVNCTCLITDSFHGICLAIIYKKPFVAIVDKQNNRGITRFTSLLKLLNLENRLIFNIDELNKIDLLNIDYAHVETLLQNEIVESMQFLKRAIMPIDKLIYSKEEEAKVNRMDEYVRDISHHKFISLEGFASNAQQQINNTDTQINMLNEYIQDISHHKFVNLEGFANNAQQQINILHNRIAQVESNLLDISKSRSFAIGRLLTFIPRKIKHMFNRVFQLGKEGKK
jgi:coenzyme F420-reducing hydrogenase beta subunit